MNVLLVPLVIATVLSLMLYYANDASENAAHPYVEAKLHTVGGQVRSGNITDGHDHSSISSASAGSSVEAGNITDGHYPNASSSSASDGSVGGTRGHPYPNQSQLVYLVGVEGAGHHGVFQVLQRLAAQSGLVVLPRDKGMRAALMAHSRQDIAGEFSKSENRSPEGKHVFLEDSSFPGGDYCRRTTSASIKLDCPRYDLRWMINTVREERREARAILLSRPFVNQVWSHNKWDGGLRKHATVLAEYMHFISDELDNEALMDDNLWARIDYTQFDDEQCPGTVTRLAAFLDWAPPSDPAKFCKQVGFRMSNKAPEIEEADAIWLDELQRSSGKNWSAYLRSDKALV